MYCNSSATYLKQCLLSKPTWVFFSSSNVVGLNETPWYDSQFDKLDLTRSLSSTRLFLLPIGRLDNDPVLVGQFLYPKITIWIVRFLPKIKIKKKSKLKEKKKKKSSFEVSHCSLPLQLGLVGPELDLNPSPKSPGQKRHRIYSKAKFCWLGKSHWSVTTTYLPKKPSNFFFFFFINDSKESARTNSVLVRDGTDSTRPEF